MVTTRRTANAQQLQQAAVAAIDRGGERALKAMLGIPRLGRRQKPTRKVVAPLRPCVAQEREIQRLRAVVAALKAGRTTAAQRATRTTPEYRQVNLFAKTNALWGGQSSLPADMAWMQAQVPETRNRELARQRARRQVLRAVRSVS